jgi:HK97 family phage portal protein
MPKPGVLALVGENLKALRLPFPGGGGWSTGTGAGWSWSGGFLGRYSTVLGSRDYTQIVGDGSHSSIVSACVNWIARTFPEAPPAVWRQVGDEIPQIVRRHALVQMLRRPNPYYSGVLLWMATLVSWTIDGNAYWVKRRSAMGNVVELWYVPHWMMEPRWPSDGSQFISHYDYRPAAGELVQIPAKDVFHLRYGLDPENTRKGRSPLHGLYAEIYTDDEAMRFTAAILHNFGMPGVVVSPGTDTKKVASQDEMDAIKAKFKAEFTGDKRGDPIVLNRPTHVEQFGFSPNELDLGALRDIPEERVTAALGIPAAVVGFGAGMQTAKVGATMSELRDQAWEGNIIPTQRLIGEELTLQLLPDFATDADLQELEVGFDLSNVRVLQDAQTAVAERHATLVRAHIEKVGEARAHLGYPVSPEDMVYMPQPGVVAPPGDNAPKLLDDEWEQKFGAMEIQLKALEARFGGTAGGDALISMFKEAMAMVAKPVVLPNEDLKVRMEQLVAEALTKLSASDAERTASLTKTFAIALENYMHQHDARLEKALSTSFEKLGDALGDTLSQQKPAVIEFPKAQKVRLVYRDDGKVDHTEPMEEAI